MPSAPVPAPQEPVPDSAPAARPEGGTSEVSAGPIIEIVLANGRRLRVPPGLEEATLARLIRIAEAA